MAYITVEDANAWTDKNKLFVTDLDADLANQQAAEVLNRISAVYDVTGWTDNTNTPTLVRKIMAMLYVGWYYQKTYSEDEDTNSYGLMLMAKAEALLDSIANKSLPLVGEVLTTTGVTNYSGDVYPNDLSSSQAPTYDDPSLGGPAFTMGTIW